MTSRLVFGRRRTTTGSRSTTSQSPLLAPRTLIELSSRPAWNRPTAAAVAALALVRPPPGFISSTTEPRSLLDMVLEQVYICRHGFR